MAFAVLSDNRLVVAVAETQSAANALARTDAKWNAHSGAVSDKVEPGNYLNAAGAILSTLPAVVRNATELDAWKAELTAAFVEGYNAEPLWRSSLLISAEAPEYWTAQLRYRYHQAALGLLVAQRTIFTGLTRDNRTALMNHIFAALRTLTYRRFTSVSKTLLGQWQTVAVTDGSQIYSDLATSSGAVRTSDLAYTSITGAAIPTGFADNLEVP